MYTFSFSFTRLLTFLPLISKLQTTTAATTTAKTTTTTLPTTTTKTPPTTLPKTTASKTTWQRPPPPPRRQNRRQRRARRRRARRMPLSSTHLPRRSSAPCQRASPSTLSADTLSTPTHKAQKTRPTLSSTRAACPQRTHGLKSPSFPGGGC